jgi:hypothetical protein
MPRLRKGTWDTFGKAACKAPAKGIEFFCAGQHTTRRDHCAIQRLLGGMYGCNIDVSRNVHATEIQRGGKTT